VIGATFSEKGTQMEGLTFMAGTIIVEGGLIALIMWLLTASEREAGQAEHARRRLQEIEADEQRLRAGRRVA
jgi:hypothetical protein